VANGRLWTARELETLRRTYPRGVPAARAALPRRTRDAVIKRAHKLGLRLCPAWTAAERHVLRRDWQHVSARTLCARLPRHSWGGIREHALRVLGLPSGPPEGAETFEAACRRTGFERAQLARLCAWAGVALRRGYSPRGVGPLRRAVRWVDSEEIDEAVRRWHRTENVGEAARARGICPNWLRGALTRLGLLPPAAARARRRQRLPSADIDRAIAMVEGPARKRAA